MNAYNTSFNRSFKFINTIYILYKNRALKKPHFTKCGFSN